MDVTSLSQLTSMNINGSIEYTANFNLVSIVYLSIFPDKIWYKNMIAADLNLAASKRLGEAGQKFTGARRVSPDRLGEN